MNNHIGIVSHDAGGAEILSRLIKKIQAHYLFSIAGPAIDIFRRNFGEFENLAIEDLVEKADYLICGTSWKSTHENIAIKLANEQNKHVISVLDHYSCYLERYIKPGFNIVPREIWVTDLQSFELAQKLSPSAKISIVGNPYLEDLKKQFEQLDKHTPSSEYKDILYLTEPTMEQAQIQSGSENAFGYTEFDALRYFLGSLWRLGGDQIIRVHLRTHPSELQDKYREFIGDFGQFQVLFCQEKDILISISKVHAIAGCDTMGLLLGVKIGIPVFSSLPPNSTDATIPTEGIVYLRTSNEIIEW